jgi:hypothetical protein
MYVGSVTPLLAAAGVPALDAAGCVEGAAGEHACMIIAAPVT